MSLEQRKLVQVFDFDACLPARLGAVKESIVKKLSAVAVAFVPAVALIVGAGGYVESAQAVYPNSVRTVNNVSTPSTITQGKTFRVKIRVRAGNAQVTSGRVLVIFNGRAQQKNIKSGVVTFTVKSPKRRGTKVLKAYYRPVTGSVFVASTERETLRVVKE